MRLILQSLLFKFIESMKKKELKKNDKRTTDDKKIIDDGNIKQMAKKMINDEKICYVIKSLLQFTTWFVYCIMCILMFCSFFASIEFMDI